MTKLVALERQTVVFIGNCIAEMIAAGLTTSRFAAELFDIVAVPLHLTSIDASDVQLAIARATFIFVQQIADVHINQINLKRHRSSELIGLPNLVMRSFWPFIDLHEFKDDVITHQSPCAAEHMHDSALAFLRKIEPNKELRIRKYYELDLELAGRVDRVIEAQERFLREIDNVTQTHIGRFILWHSADLQLFYNTTHPSGITYQKLCEFAWRRLGLTSKPPAFGGVDHWRHDSYPIYPRIARRLGLKWADEYTQYNCNKWGMLTWGEWVRRHIEIYG